MPSVVQRQIEKLIAEASQKSLESGKVLDLAEIEKLITEKVRQLDGLPTLEVRRQFNKLSTNDYNTMMEEILFDLNVLYECLVEKTADLFAIYNNSDVSYRAQKNQIARLKGLVDDLLFTVKNADDFFFGVFDDFTSLDKVNTPSSTEGVVDVAEAAALLPFSLPSAIRVPFNHLIKETSGEIEVQAIDGTSANGQNGAGSLYGYAFSDIRSIWRYEVISESTDGVQMAFTFPIRNDNEIERITRVELCGIAGSPLNARLLFSLDKENFRSPSGAKDKNINDADKIAWDFPETPVRYLRLILTKRSYDAPYKISTISSRPTQSEDTGKFLYNFNIANVSVFRLGRTIDAILRSKPLKPLDAPDRQIDNISISAREELAPFTDIEYYIGLSDSRGNMDGDFIPINPTNRVDNDIAKVIKVGESITDTIEFSGSYIDITPTEIESKSLQLYDIYQLSGDYRFGSAKLYRGDGLFSRTFNSRTVTKRVSDNFIDFSDGIRTKELYAYKTETAQIINRNVGVGNAVKTFLKVSETIKTSAKPVRERVTDPIYTVDTEPDYAVAEVRHVRPDMSITDQPISPSGGAVIVNGVSIPIAGSWFGTSQSSASIGVPILLNNQVIDIVRNGPNAPVLKYKSSGGFEYIYQEGIDYDIKRSDDDYFNNFPGWNPLPLHWRIVPAEPISTIVNSGSTLTGVYGGTGVFFFTGSSLPPTTLGSVSTATDEELFISYSIDPDITHRVQSVSYDSSEIELDGPIQIMPGDTIESTYRFVPQAVVRDSIRVTQNFGSDNQGQIFVEGTDYTIDPNNGTITKVAGGGITNLGSEVVYVDFSYIDAIAETETYSIWAYVGSREPIKFDFNSLNLREGSGESFTWTYIDGNSNSRDLTRATSFVMTKGWHFFTIRSLSPDRFSDAAINKIIKLRSLDSNYLFLNPRRGGKIFDRLTAYRNPLTQVTYAFLKDATLKADHTKFAINDTENKVYINFRPGDTTDLYMKEINASGEVSDVNTEYFTFSGKRPLNNNGSNATHVILRARLSRADGSNGGVTPKLHSYNIRLSY